MTVKVDAISIELMRNAFHTIAEEMGVALIRTALSPNIKDRRDCSTAIYNKEGLLIAQAEHVPLHLGLMQSVVKEVLQIFGTDGLKDGDAILFNDPYRSGSHIPDIFVIAPVYYNGELVAITANTAHHVDMGGLSPGSCSVDTTEIFQEGIRLPGIRVRKQGTIDEEVIRLLAINSRTSKEMVGDIYAQLAANKIGEMRLKELFGKYSAAFLEQCMKEIMDYSDRRMRAAILKVPDGVYSFEDYLEGDGRTEQLIMIKVEVQVAGDTITLDFTGSSPQVKGPVNAPLGITRACAYYAIMALLDPDVPPNAGTYRSIRVTAPEGTIVSARFPAPVATANGNTSQRITDAILGALAPTMPEAAMAACCGTMNGFNFGGLNPATNEYFSYIESCGGGQGATLGLDGMSGLHTNMTNTRNTPAEVIEQSYPLLVTRYSFSDLKGGYGKYRGGKGIVREVMADIDDIIVTISSERFKLKPWGLFGGKEGAGSSCVLISSEGKETVLPPKVTMSLKKGQSIANKTPGGGGYMNPLERDPERVRQDVVADFISHEEAYEEYGVVLTPELDVDMEQTEALRSSLVY